MKSKWYVPFALPLLFASTADAQITSAVMTVTGAEMHWWAGVAVDATARLYDVDDDSLVFERLRQKNRYDQGTITFRARKGKLIDLNKLRESIWATRLSGRTSSGLVELNVTVVGQIVETETGLTLRVANSDAVFQLVRNGKGKQAAAYEQLLAARKNAIVQVAGLIPNYRGRWPILLKSQPTVPRRIVVGDVTILE